MISEEFAFKRIHFGVLGSWLALDISKNGAPVKLVFTGEPVK